MDLAVSTRWNASRHKTGEAMVEEVLQLGLSRMELGYDTRVDLLPGIEAMLDAGTITVNSVHNYCPVPMGAPRGHPELWTFADLDQRVHELAVQHTLRTMQFAADINAKIVVIHCGYVQQRKTSTRDLMDLVARNQFNSPRYEKQFMKFIKERDKRVGKHLDQVRKALEYLLPHAEQLNVELGLENLPTLEAVPNEGEMEQLVQEFQHPKLKYWHDMGHGQIRENLGFINHMRWLERLTPCLGGLHVHDVADKLQDHVMPPDGELGLERFRPYSLMELPLVIEPSPRATFEELQSCVAWLKHWWEDAPQPAPREEQSLPSDPSQS
ncbi:TIM barrel protein [Kiritimatiellota bacterium B12222]|nr:TIM barrel protein [Kiritimatiellota bacterium B12222]